MMRSEVGQAQFQATMVEVRAEALPSQATPSLPEVPPVDQKLSVAAAMSQNEMATIEPKELEKAVAASNVKQASEATISGQDKKQNPRTTAKLPELKAAPTLPKLILTTRHPHRNTLTPILTGPLSGAPVPPDSPFGLSQPATMRWGVLCAGKQGRVGTAAGGSGRAESNISNPERDQDKSADSSRPLPREISNNLNRTCHLNSKDDSGKRLKLEGQGRLERELPKTQLPSGKREGYM